MKKKIALFLIMGMVSLCTFGQEKKRIGIIGLDTSHAVTFAAMFNGPDANPEFSNYKVSVAYPWGSRTIEAGYTRVPEYTEQVKKLGIKIAASIEELLGQVDYVMLETQDGHLHVEQALEVFKAGKPLFIDKPMAANLSDVCLIFELGKKYKVPVYTTSSLRYTDPVLEISGGGKGKVLGAECYGPCQDEPSHPSLYWYGIHGVEMLFGVMGTGCESVSKVHTEDTDVAVGVWKDGRIGSYRGMREGKKAYYHFGGSAFCEKEVVSLDNYKGYGYHELLKGMLKFFETGNPPVSHETAIEVYAFMDAANQSQLTGKSVNLAQVIKQAKATALKKLKRI